MPLIHQPSPPSQLLLYPVCKDDHSTGSSSPVAIEMKETGVSTSLPSLPLLLSSLFSVALDGSSAPSQKSVCKSSFTFHISSIFHSYADLCLSKSISTTFCILQVHFTSIPNIAHHTFLNYLIPPPPMFLGCHKKCQKEIGSIKLVWG